MNPTIEIFEQYGLITAEKVRDFVFSLTASRWNKFRDEIAASVVTDEVIDDSPDLAPFNFLASASLRGEAGCTRERCRLNKVNMLARYSALFCDRVVVPFHLHRIGDSESPSYLEQSYLAITLISMLELRPLVEAGIVRLAAELDFCPRCQPDRFKPTQEILDTADRLMATNYSKFGLYKKRMNGQDKVVLTGPEEFIEHGSLVKNGTPHIPIQGFRYGRLPDSFMRKSRSVERIFDKIIKDTVLQQIYGLRFNTKFLTDLPGEATVLAALNENDQLAARTAALCAQLTHQIPLLSDVPLETVIRIRREDHTVFLNYRCAIQKIIKDYVVPEKIIGSTQAKELFADILEPELRKMEVKAQTERTSLLKKSGTKLAVTVAAVYLGVHTGMLPDQLAAIVAAMGGFSALGNFAESIASLSPSSVRNDNLFFLLQLKRETD